MKRKGDVPFWGCFEGHRSERDAAGHAVVVRNGTARPRTVTTGVGPVAVAAPRVTKGAGSRTAGLTMAFKLLEASQAHWRRLDSAELIPLVRAGVEFVDGVRVERQQERKKGAA